MENKIIIFIQTKIAQVTWVPISGHQLQNMMHKGISFKKISKYLYYLKEKVKSYLVFMARRKGSWEQRLLCL